MSRSKAKTRLPEMPVSLKDATAFAKDAGELNAMWLVRQLKALPQFWEGLRTATSAQENWGSEEPPHEPWGRPRLPGHWALAYLAYVVSQQADVQPWWNHTTDDLWRECGFIERPRYYTVWERFAELEEHAAAFNDCAAALIQHAHKASGGLVGRDLHVDSTEAETNARLIHSCPKDSKCWEEHKNRYGFSRAITAEANIDEVKAERHAASEYEPDEEDEKDEEDEGEAEELLGDAGRRRWYDEDGRLFVRVGKKEKQECIYEVLDPTAGVRAYTRGERAFKF